MAGLEETPTPGAPQGHLLSAIKDEPPRALLVIALLAVQEALASLDRDDAGVNASRIFLAETALRSLRLKLAAAGAVPCVDRIAR